LPAGDRRAALRTVLFVVYISIVVSAVIGAPLIFIPFYLLQEAV
jgi:hypothetical protein